MHTHAGTQWISMISGEPSRGVLSKTKTQKCRQLLTFWRSQTGIVNRLEMQQGFTVTHQLNRWGQVSLTGQKSTRHDSLSLAKGQRTGIVSRLEGLKGTAEIHILQSQRQALLVELRCSQKQQPLTSWKRQEQEWSVGLKCSKAQQQLTDWRTKDRHDQQAWKSARLSSHSQAEKSRIGVLSVFKIQQGIVVTHSLRSREHTLSPGLKHSSKYSNHLLSKKPRIDVISGVETQQGMAATHFLKSRE